MIDKAGQVASKQIISLYGNSYKELKLPKSWKEPTVIPIPKGPNKGGFRPISLTPCIGKWMERIILNRLIWKLGSLHININGFCKGKGTGHCVINLLSNDEKKIAIFIDLEKAFELASPTVIVDILINRGVKGYLIGWIKDYLVERRARVKYQGAHSRSFPLENGTPQGGVLSPTLFNLLMDELLRARLPKTVEIVSYADDLVIVVKGGNAIRDGQEALNILTNKCNELGLKISKDKSRVMAFKLSLETENLTMQGHRLEWVQEYRSLGIVIDNRLLFTNHVNDLRERLKSRVRTMRVMTSSKVGANSKVLRTFYVQAIRSLVDYSSHALFLVSNTKLKKLETQQNNALRIMAHAPQWTKIVTLKDLFQLEGLEDRIQKLSLSLVIKIYKKGENTTAWKNIHRSMNDRKQKGKWSKKVR